MNPSRKSQQGSRSNSNILRGKSFDEKTNSLIQLSKKLKNTYLLTIFEETKEKEVYRCKICSKTTLEYKNIKRHLLDSETYNNLTPLDDIGKLIINLRQMKKKKIYRNWQNIKEAT